MNDKKLKKIRNDDFHSNLIKIVVNYLQVVTIITNYKFEWPSYVSPTLLEVLTKLDFKSL